LPNRENCGEPISVESGDDPGDESVLWRKNPTGVNYQGRMMDDDKDGGGSNERTEPKTIKKGGADWRGSNRTMA
jgi:hypothetical protein